MTQGARATVLEDILSDPTAKCLAEISDLIGSKLAEPAPHAPPRDAWNSQPEAHLFNEEVVIKEVLEALPNGSAITFTADRLEVLFSGGGPVLADAKTAATIIDTCGCCFALHGDTVTFTKNLIDTAASAQMNVPRSPIMFGKSKSSSHEEDKLLPPVQQLQNLTPAHLAASEPAAKSSIGPGMTIVGKISSEGIANVFGRVEGEPHASTVRIPDGAEGTLAAQELTIGGRFKGTIHANRITLTSSPVVEGEIHHRSLPIGENAWIAGELRPKEASVSEDTDPPSQPVPTDANRELNGSLTQPNFSPILPVVESSDELPFYCKTHGNGYRTTQGGLPNVQYERREFPAVYSVGSQDQSAKRISRGSLQIAILALTVGAITGAGVVLVLLGHPSHQYIASLTARPPAIIIQQAANLPTPEPASDGLPKVSAETPEHAALPWPVPLDAYSSPPMNSPSSQISGAPDHLGQMTNRTSALDMPSSLAGAANEEDARQTGRKTFRYIRDTQRFADRHHRYRYAFHRYWHRYRYAFHSLRKGWI